MVGGRVRVASHGSFRPARSVPPRIHARNQRWTISTDSEDGRECQISFMNLSFVHESEKALPAIAVDNTSRFHKRWSFGRTGGEVEGQRRGERVAVLGGRRICSPCASFELAVLPSSAPHVFRMPRFDRPTNTTYSRGTPDWSNATQQPVAHCNDRGRSFLSLRNRDPRPLRIE